MTEPQLQSVSAKRAESRRPFHGKAILEDPVIRSRFSERANIMLKDLKMLEKENVSFTPFLEIGAGSVHRSAALINNYPVDGVATDISQKSLRDTPYVLSMLGYD